MTLGTTDSLVGEGLISGGAVAGDTGVAVGATSVTAAADSIAAASGGREAGAGDLTQDGSTMATNRRESRIRVTLRRMVVTSRLPLRADTLHAILERASARWARAIMSE